jgi:hypothetical protein
VIRPVHPSASEGFSDSLGRALFDCSTADYLCVSTFKRVFAIPREPYTAGKAFAIGGIQVRIEKCLREGARGCGVALVSAYCGPTAEIDRCGSSSEAKGEDLPPPVFTYFIYNEDYGVTAWGVRVAPPATMEEKLMAAREMMLQGAEGLLKAGITTKKAK